MFPNPFIADFTAEPKKIEFVFINIKKRKKKKLPFAIYRSFSRIFTKKHSNEICWFILHKYCQNRTKIAEIRSRDTGSERVKTFTAVQGKATNCKIIWCWWVWYSRRNTPECTFRSTEILSVIRSDSMRRADEESPPPHKYRRADEHECAHGPKHKRERKWKADKVNKQRSYINFNQ